MARFASIWSWRVSSISSMLCTHSSFVEFVQIAGETRMCFRFSSIDDICYVSFKYSYACFPLNFVVLQIFRSILPPTLDSVSNLYVLIIMIIIFGLLIVWCYSRGSENKSHFVLFLSRSNFYKFDKLSKSRKWIFCINWATMVWKT